MFGFGKSEQEKWLEERELSAMRADNGTETDEDRNPSYREIRRHQKMVAKYGTGRLPRDSQIG